IGDAASVVSAIPSVREALVNFQRQFAADPPGAVLDGRDIGTVICPNADVKIFVVADPQVRARRRTLEALARGEAADEAMVLADILKRDERDKNRAAAPLKAAADAHILDNSNLDIEGGVRAAIAIVEAVRAGRGSFRWPASIRASWRLSKISDQFFERARSNGNCCSAIMTGFDLAAAIALSVAKAAGLPATAVATVKTAMAVRAIRLFMVAPCFWTVPSCGAALKVGFHLAEGCGAFASCGQQGVEAR